MQARILPRLLPHVHLGRPVHAGWSLVAATLPAAVPGQPRLAVRLRCAHVSGHQNLNRLPGVPVRVARIQNLHESLLENVLHRTPRLCVRHLRSATPDQAAVR